MSICYNHGDDQAGQRYAKEDIMLTAEEVLTSIGSTVALADVEKLWDDSMAAYPGADKIPFLKDDAIISNRKATGFGDEMDEPFR